ncbi:MAG: YbjQ family protein [Oscillospiraceae bacterium]|nr:YbjQ family protein [Oscillospiraceae bacterium]
MQLLSIETYPGRTFQALGLVRGSIVTTKNFGKDFMAGMKSLVGGELAGYTEMLNDARATATARMVEDAQRLGADAVIGVRYASSSLMQGAAEAIAYGTAIRFLD